jgi:endo-1,4-beta-D-glucanase Y
MTTVRALTMNDLATHKTVEAWTHSRVASGEREAWLRWIHQAEKLLKKSLNGDFDTDGYSCDMAYSLFLLNVTPTEYINHLNQR